MRKNLTHWIVLAMLFIGACSAQCQGPISPQLPKPQPLPQITGLLN